MLKKTALKPQTRRKRRDALPEILSPTVDIIFKKLFGDERNKDILANFLTAVLGFKVLPSHITLIDPHLTRKYANSKLGIIDVRLKLKSGKIINIEMQVGNLKGIRSRLEYYISDTIAGQLKKGDKYLKLAPVVMILISKNRLLPETERFHCEFGTLEKTEHFELHGLRTIHILDLSKLPEDGGGVLVEWLKFINAKKREVFMTLAQECRQLRRALSVLEETSANEKTRLIYEARLKAARDKMAEIDYAQDKGFNKGIRRGKKEGRAEGRVEGREEVFALIERGISPMEAKRMLGVA